MAKKTKNLTERNKLYIAIFLTLLILAGIIFISLSVFSPDRSDSENNNDDFNISRSELIEKLSVSAKNGVEPTDILVQRIKLTDLPVYPVEWQKKFFKTSELANQLVSGEAADPDKDGLTNKEEYFQGASPINPDTLCNGDVDDVTCFGKNDGENVAEGISPLTGLSLDAQPEFLIKRQDFAILDNIQDTFEIAAREGVDFPSLYILSKSIDLQSEIDEIGVLEQEDNRQNFLNYTRLRIDILDDFTNQDELSNFAEIYQITDVNELENIRLKYVELQDKMINTTVPTRFVPSHKAYILIFEKMEQLIEQRKQGFENKDLLTDEFRDVSRDKAVEVVWGYRELNKQISILEENFDL